LRWSLEREINQLEEELAKKKEVLQKLQEVGVLTLRRRKRSNAGRKRVAETKIMKGDGRVRPSQRSTNRDIVLAVARTFSGKFKLHELLQKVKEVHPTFGGSYPSGILIGVLKRTPEIKKVARGVYKYVG